MFAPVLPVGISFYTFQAISYLADVYRKTAEYEPSFVNFAMYISMISPAVAGPIVTYSSIKKEISRRSHSMRAVEEGLKTFTIGLGLKVLLANRLAGSGMRPGPWAMKVSPLPLHGWPSQPSASRSILIFTAIP